MARSLIATSEPAGAPHVVDLGCGVGASLCYLAERLPIRATGITLSPVQARLAAQRVRDAGLSGRVECIEADYCDLPAGVGRADLAYAVESFVHGPAPDRFFSECRRLVRPNGLLVICDDVGRPAAGAAAARAIDRFCRGWRINALLQQDELRALARAAGFEHRSTVDLTSALEIYRARDRVIGVLGAVCGPAAARCWPVRSPAGRRRPPGMSDPRVDWLRPQRGFAGLVRDTRARRKVVAKRGHNGMVIRNRAEPRQR